MDLQYILPGMQGEHWAQREEKWERMEGVYNDIIFH
jgi:hypothetical protein